LDALGIGRLTSPRRRAEAPRRVSAFCVGRVQNATQIFDEIVYVGEFESSVVRNPDFIYKQVHNPDVTNPDLADVRVTHLFVSP
jgi:hypothetical protein